MGKIKSITSIFILIIFLSCQETNVEKRESENNQINPKSIYSPNSTYKKDGKYLSQKELYDFLNQTKPIEIKSQAPKPFNNLKYNKVIAYDFDGIQEPYPSVINSRNNAYAPVILRQKELTEKQVEFLIDFLTDNKTYGEYTSACFDPHMGIVFYENEQRKFVVNICLDCNYLISTIEIPSTQFKTVTFDEGGSYGLRGFSEIGKEKIIELSKQLNLDYGKINLK